MNERKPGLAAFGFALMLLSTPSHGQHVGPPYVGPPHNIIYWGGNTSNGEWNKLLSSYYTDVIINFVSPDANCNVSSGNWLPYVQALHLSGKNVLIAFGGGGIPSANYLACTRNIPRLAQQLAAIVNNNGFDGVDIDFEDTGSFGGRSGYDGIAFLESLTRDLYQNLTFPNTIITHAPQTPYWTQTYYYGNYSSPPYTYVYNTVGKYIAWYNVQTYNQCNPGGTDCTWQQKFADYKTIVNSGVPPITLVMGLPVNWCSTADNQGNCSGNGWLNSSDTSTLITQLQQTYPDQFGGVMGWNFDQDLNSGNYYGSQGWSFFVYQALYANQAPWWVDNLQTWHCLDSNASSVYTDTCANLPGQFWKFSGNSIVNTATGKCLDAGLSSLEYPCIPGDNWQSWQVRGIIDQNGQRNGFIVRNARTGSCLDSGQSPPIFPCNGGNWQQWTGGW